MKKTATKTEETAAVMTASNPAEQVIKSYNERKAKGEALKAKFKVDGVHRITTYDKDGNEIECWVKTPGFPEVSAYMSVINRDPVQANKILLVNTWLEGNTELQSNIHYFTSIIPRLGELVEVRQASAEKF